MGRFATMAESHWRRHLPEAYSRIADKPAFFEEIEGEAINQLEATESHLRGEDPPDETFGDRLRRFGQARAVAEEIVIREVVLVAPSAPPLEPADTDLADAVADFHGLREQFYNQAEAEGQPAETPAEPAFRVTSRRVTVELEGARALVGFLSANDSREVRMLPRVIEFHERSSGIVLAVVQGPSISTGDPSDSDMTINFLVDRLDEGALHRDPHAPGWVREIWRRVGG